MGFFAKTKWKKRVFFTVFFIFWGYINFFVNDRDLFVRRTAPRWSNKLHFFLLFFRFFCKINPVCRQKKVEKKTSAVNMKKPEKSRKKSKNSIFSVFLAYFSKSPRYIENLKKKHPRIWLFWAFSWNTIENRLKNDTFWCVALWLFVLFPANTWILSQNYALKNSQWGRNFVH